MHRGASPTIQENPAEVVGIGRVESVGGSWNAAQQILLPEELATIHVGCLAHSQHSNSGRSALAPANAN